MRARRHLLVVAAALAIVVACATTGIGQSSITYLRKVRVTSTAADAVVAEGRINGRQGVVVEPTTASSPYMRILVPSPYTSVTLQAGDNAAYLPLRFETLANRATDGTAAAPAWSFVNSPASGIFSPSASAVGVSIAGASKTEWYSAAVSHKVPVYVPDGSAAAPAYSFNDAAATGLFRTGGNAVGWSAGGVQGGELAPTGVSLLPAARGSGFVTGPYVSIGRNSSGAGASGCLSMQRRDGVQVSLYFASDNLLRFNDSATNCPTENNASPHTGAVIGDQTSSLASKHLLGQPADSGLLDAVLRTKVHRFTYRDGRYDGETFTGIVTDESPWFGKDHNKALNEINGIGYLVGAVRELERRLAASEARVAVLERQRRK